MGKLIHATQISKYLKKAQSLYEINLFDEAKRIYEEILKIKPSQPQALINLGAIELQLGNVNEGINLLKKSLEIDPSQPQTLLNLGNGYLSLKEFSRAIDHYNLAIKINPNFFEAYSNKGMALRQLNQFDAAVSCYKKAIEISPHYIQAIFNLGFLFNQIGKYQDAIFQYDLALTLTKDKNIFYNKAIAAENLSQYEIALINYDNAINLDPCFFLAYCNKTGLLEKMKKYDDAITACDKYINICPKHEDIYIQKAFIFLSLGKTVEANKIFCEAEKIFPNCFELFFSKSLFKFITNDFISAWGLYEYRWMLEQKNKFLKTTKPRLSNLEISKKIILIWPEQGLGDQIIFSSLLDEIFQTSNDFIVLIDARLIDLFQRSFSRSNVKFLPEGSFVSESSYDFHLPLGDLGKFLRTSPEDFKKQKTKFLKSNHDLVLNYKKLYQESHVKICGISWKSSNLKIGPNKSLSLDLLIPLLNINYFKFIDLQYGDNANEKSLLKNKYGIELDCPYNLDKFNDIDALSSLIDACDFIVTSSNVTAHIAGALGKETFLLLPYSSKSSLWYWQHSKNHIFWYPSIHIYKVGQMECWEDVIKKLVLDLKDYGRNY